MAIDASRRGGHVPACGGPQAANDRYAEALAALDTTTPLGQLAATVCRPVSKDGRRYRALHPFSPEDRELLEGISDGAYVTEGFRNGDVALRLYGSKSGDPDKSEVASRRRFRINCASFAHTV